MDLALPRDIRINFCPKIGCCGNTPLTPNSGPSVWPKGWMDQSATWYGGRPRPRRHCVRWKPISATQHGGAAAPYFRPMYCGQTAAWIKMLLGREVGLGQVTLC